VFGPRHDIVGRIEANELAGDPTTMKPVLAGGDKMLAIRYEPKD